MADKFGAGRGSDTEGAGARKSRPTSSAAQGQDVPEIRHLPPEPMDSRERTLHFWLARLTSYPRWVSIGSIDSHAELQRVSREDYETIQAVLRGK